MSTAPNTRARSEALKTTAAEIIQAVGGIEELDQILPHQRKLALQKLYHQMVTVTGCHWTTAKTHITKSIRCQRHPDETPANTWGGSRGGGQPKKERKNMEFKATRCSKKFGWGYSTNPSGDGPYSISAPTSPDYEGTIGQVTDAIATDPVYNNLGGAFSATRWFYRGRIITHVDGLEAYHVDSMGQITLMELAEDEARHVTEVMLTVE